MTGIGIATDSFNDSAVTMEIKSVNHRYLDINFRMPGFISLLEKDFRDSIREKINRGKIYLSVNFEKSSNLYSDILVDVELAGHYFNGLKAISEKLRIPNEVKTTDFVKMKGIFDLKERELDEEFKAFSLKLLAKAVDSLNSMKEEEGRYLENDILNRIEKLKGYIKDIDKFKEQIVQKYKEKLEKNIERIFGKQSDLINEKRVEFEIVQFADKTDVTEEIVRFNSHIRKFLSTIELKPPIGKKLDFILQEMNREINTIGSKNVLPEISNIIIESKTEVEKIREQIQNIE
jgi:uncharacterized protein (TIGR00255 family)